MGTKTTLPPVLTPEPEKTYGPHHKPFSWLYTCEFDPKAEFAATTYDVCRGVEICLEILMNEQLRVQSHGDDDTDPEDRSLLGTHGTERLLRLALAATKMLGNDADIVITDYNRRARKEDK